MPFASHSASRWLLLAILVLAFGLRVHALGAQSLWYDEAVTAQVVGQGLPELARWTADDIQPPLYYVVLAAWTRWVGASEWMLRLPSACFGLLMVALGYAIGRRLFGRAAGLIAALLAATHPLFIYYSQEARMYTLLTALGMLAGYALLRVGAAGGLRLAWGSRHSEVAYANHAAAPSTPGQVIAEAGPPGDEVPRLHRSAPSTGLDGHTGARQRRAPTQLVTLSGSGGQPPRHANASEGPRPGASGYVGGQRTRSTRHSRRLLWWLVFILAGVAALYTHYFAAFLLLAFGVFFALALLRHWLAPRARLLGEGSLAALIIALAYLPWLPNALRRFGEDASYWRGALKLHEALRHVAISYTVGETVLEQQATPAAWAVTALALGCLISLLWLARPRPLRSGDFSRSSPLRSGDFSRPSVPSVLFVLIYLLVPIASILLLAYNNPKFNPRYLMLASPAFILLLAGGLAWPFAWTNDRSPLPGAHPDRSSRLAFPALLSLSLLAALLLLSLWATHNWFVDPAFTKDDWRGAVTYVRAQLQPDERVVLVSGHAYPAWRYYAADIEPLRLPASETLDVNAVVDLSVAEQLNTALAGNRGAWLVQWQADVVDPNGVVPFLLDTVGEAEPPTASFWGLAAPQHYRFVDAVRSGPDAPGTAFPTELPLTAAYQGQQLAVNFGGQVELVGYSQPPCAQPLCPVYLFWRALQPLSADLKLTATLLGRYNDHTWSQPLDRRLAAYTYPTFRWPPGQVVLSRLEVPAERGTPPGEYRLRLGVYDAATGQALDVLDAAGAAQGRWAWLEPVVAAGLIVAGPGGPPADSTPIAVAPDVALQALVADRSAVEPGDPIRLDAWWQAIAAPARDYAVNWQWLDPAGQVYPGGGWRAPAAPDFPSAAWPAGALVRGQLDLFPPYDAPPGNWRLRIGLVDAAAERGDAPFAGAAAELPLRVLPSTRRFAPSAAFDYPSGANFSFLIELLGVRLDRSTLQPSGTLSVTVGWRDVQPMDTSYTGFVHLLDADGRVVAQDDHTPLQGQRPTTTWAAGEVVEDLYTLRLPADLPAGPYRLEIGLYDAGRPGLPRLRTVDGTDSVLIGELTTAP